MARNAPCCYPNARLIRCKPEAAGDSPRDQSLTWRFRTGPRTLFRILPCRRFVPHRYVPHTRHSWSNTSIDHAPLRRADDAIQFEILREC